MRCPGFRAFPLPSADVDRDGRVWATWHDCVPGGSSNAVYVATSADGATWTAAAAVTRNRNAVLPAIGIDAGTGRVAIAYMRSGANGVDVELVVVRGRGDRLRRAAETVGGGVGIAVDGANDLRTHARGLHLGPLLEWTTARRVGARLDADQRSLPRSRVRHARLSDYQSTRQRPIGCQTVLSSRNDSISHGLWTSAEERTTRFTFSAAARSSSATSPSTPVRSIGVHVHVAGEPGRELVDEAGEDVDRTAREVGGRDCLGELDRGYRVCARRDGDDRVPTREGG